MRQPCCRLRGTNSIKMSDMEVEEDLNLSQEEVLPATLLTETDGGSTHGFGSAMMDDEAEVSGSEGGDEELEEREAEVDEDQFAAPAPRTSLRSTGGNVMSDSDSDSDLSDDGSDDEREGEGAGEDEARDIEQDRPAIRQLTAEDLAEDDEEVRLLLSHVTRLGILIEADRSKKTYYEAAPDCLYHLREIQKILTPEIGRAGSVCALLSKWSLVSTDLAPLLLSLQPKASYKPFLDCISGKKGLDFDIEAEVAAGLRREEESEASMSMSGSGFFSTSTSPVRELVDFVRHMHAANTQHTFVNTMRIVASLTMPIVSDPIRTGVAYPPQFIEEMRNHQRQVKLLFCDDQLLQLLRCFLLAAVLTPPKYRSIDPSRQRRDDRRDESATFEVASEENEIIELVLTVLRNLLRLPDERSTGESHSMTSKGHLQSLQLTFVVALVRSGFMDAMFLTMKDSIDGTKTTRNLMILECFTCIFANLTPSLLVMDPGEGTLGGDLPPYIKSFHETAAQEKRKQEMQRKATLGKRHPRFGGSFSISSGPGGLPSRTEHSLHDVTESRSDKRSASVLPGSTRGTAYKPRSSAAFAMSHGAAQHISTANMPPKQRQALRAVALGIIRVWHPSR